MLPGMADQLQPFWADFTASGGSEFGDYLVKRSDEVAEALLTLTGWDVSGAELRATGRRIVLAKRVYNIREGWQPADDWLPDRLLNEPLLLPSGRVAALNRGPWMRSARSAAC
jgi:Aldehyde ferredoxin oxidoreductase, domains 2 & 3